MPFIVSKVNVALSPGQEVALKERLGRVIERVPGKNERGLLLAFEDNCRMWLAGDDAPLAYVHASVFANESHAGYEAFSAEVAAAFRDVLGIPANRVYVCYADIPAFSVSDMLADRRFFG